MVSMMAEMMIGLAVICWSFLLTPTLAARKGVWRGVEAVSGREAVLACEVGSLDSSDVVYVVLWYRNSNKEPFYSYDNRPGRLQLAPEDRHTIKSPFLEGRATFRPGLVPALHIKPVLRADQANYTCRVDFRIASSRRTHLQLQVVEPPGDPLVRVEGRLVRNGVVGPLQEDQDLVITCTVAGGVPPPSLIWWRDNQIMDATIESTSGGVTVNQLREPRLSRSFHNARLTCVATNNNVTSPAVTLVTITMNLRPLVTRLENPPKSLRVGEEYQILCVSAGSRPHPNMTWTLGNLASLHPLNAQTQHGVNMSSSRVIVAASRRHHGQRLSCTAFNPLLPGHPLSDSILLNVTYPPVALISVGGGSGGVVLEGRDLYFNCNVDANPAVYKISWYHNDRLLIHSPDGGVVVGGKSLALRAITRHQAGQYVCSASNVEGDTRSLPLNLTVNYAPVCEDDATASQVFAAGAGQVINVTCGVLASPPVTKYSWVFNNSVKSERVPGSQVVVRPDGRSVAQLRPREPDDYGTLQCWAENTVGRMGTPCVFTITPAGGPERVLECSVVNQTFSSLVVGCTPGFDGGLTQSFTARVFEAVTGRGQLNVTSNEPRFTLLGLTPSLDYLIEVVASNPLGTSKPLVLSAFTYKTAENRMRNENAEEVTSTEPTNEPVVDNTVVVVMVVSGVVLMVLLVVVVVMVVKCVVVRRRQDTTTTTSIRTRCHKPEDLGDLAECSPGTPQTQVQYEMETVVVGGSVLLPPAPPRPPERS